MLVPVIIEGVASTIEKLPNGLIRVRQPWPQINAMHGSETGGEHSYDVHPCQHHQYEFLNGQLPPSDRLSAQDLTAVPRPWWSLGAGERAGLRE